MKTKTKTICPEDTEFTVFTIHHELNLKDVLSKLWDMFWNSYDNVWWDLGDITKTDFTEESVDILKDFIKDHKDSYPKGKVVIMADTELSHDIAKKTISLLRLDDFKEGHVQLFSTRHAALRWAKLADILSSHWTSRH
jgi:hypothetical protein